MYPNAIKLSDMPVNKIFPIKGIRSVKTRAYGMRLVVDISEDLCIFLTDDTNDWLTKNSEQLNKMTELIADGKIGVKRCSAMSLAFELIEADSLIEQPVVEAEEE